MPTYFDYLPKKLIDTIYEYNTDHHAIYYKVMEEFLDSYYEPGHCNSCGESIESKHKVSLYIHKYKRYFACCSCECLWYLQDYYRKAKNLRNIPYKIFTYS